MDKETQRLVKCYGLDREAHERYRRETHEEQIREICQKIENEEKSNLARFVKRKSYKIIKGNPYGSDRAQSLTDMKRKEFVFDYLENILKNWNLKPKNRERVTGLTAYLYVHTTESNKKAQKLLEQIYDSKTSQEIIEKWRDLIDYYFDRYNDI